ncbi:hypothetical protein [Cellulosimicrobium funkei]|nr:hypothetical protein [Cellulosimicrobium funkei]
MARTSVGVARLSALIAPPFGIGIGIGIGIGLGVVEGGLALVVV